MNILISHKLSITLKINSRSKFGEKYHFYLDTIWVPMFTFLTSEFFVYTVLSVIRCFSQPDGDTDFTMRSTLLTIRTLSLWRANKSLCKDLFSDEKGKSK